MSCFYDQLSSLKSYKDTGSSLIFTTSVFFFLERVYKHKDVGVHKDLAMQNHDTWGCGELIKTETYPNSVKCVKGVYDLAMLRVALCISLINYKRMVTPVLHV